MAEAGRQYLESEYAAHLVAVRGNGRLAAPPESLVPMTPTEQRFGNSATTAAALRMVRGLALREAGLAGLNEQVGQIIHETRAAHQDAQQQWERLANSVREWWHTIPDSREQWTAPQSQRFIAQVLDFGQQSEGARTVAEQQMERLARRVPVTEVESFMPDGHRYPGTGNNAAAVAERRRVLELRDRLPSIQDDGRIPGGAEAVLASAYTNPDGSVRRNTGVIIGDAADGGVATTWYTPHAVAGRLPSLGGDYNVRAVMLTGLHPAHTSQLQSMAAAGDAGALQQFLKRHYQIPYMATTIGKPILPGDVYFKGLASMIGTAHANGIQVAGIGGNALGDYPYSAPENFVSRVPAGSNYLIFSEYFNTAQPNSELAWNLNTSLGIETTIDAFHPKIHTANTLNSAHGGPAMESDPAIDIGPDEAVVNWFRNTDPSTVIWNTYPNTN